MGDMQVGVANIDDKGFYGMMEDKPGASSSPTLQVSVSFGRFENDSLSWEKFSAFSPNKYLEEVGKCATPGSVAQKKAYFEAHYKKIAERKAEIMDQEKLMDNKNASFRSVVTDQGSTEGGSVTESVVDTEEDKHVTDIAAEVKELTVDDVNEDAIIVKECQSLVNEVKEEVKNSVDSPRLEKPEESALVEEKPEEVLLMDEKEKTEIREDVSENVDTTGKTDETPKKEMEKEKTQKLIKKGGNVGVNRTRSSPKPEQVRTKPTTNKIVTSKKTPPSKEVKNMIKPTKKPAAPISKAPPGFSTPRVYKPASKLPSLSTSQSSVKKEKASSLLRNKPTAPKSLHMSMSLGPSSASDPSALTSTRKSLIMERMGDKDIVKRAFKSFQKSYDLDASVDKQKPALKQNPAKSTSIPSVATRQKDNTRPAKASGIEKRISTSAHGSASRGLKSNVTAQKELSKSGARPVEKTRLQKNPKAGVVDAKTLKESMNPKAKPVRTLPKVSSDKML
ncbi:nucleolar protein dao-5 isoform X2 [Brassica rapa]|uniref:TPX2 C-terminal domain-containing protein n=1 Tax=Brassica campestris TaxID=3711 RepID=M4E786_BRACM|nr:nucleolar protein dao-5 isoform X2 [Brassica rapa]